MMNQAQANGRRLLLAVMAGAAGLIPGAVAADSTAAVPPNKVAAAPVAPADPYPLDTCVVTGAKLGEMGEVVKYTYNGREIRFCCPGCVETFKKDPAKYLKILDNAAAKKKAKQ